MVGKDIVVNKLRLFEFEIGLAMGRALESLREED